MLPEEFKHRLPECVVVYLSEQKVTTLQQAASLADKFLLHTRLYSQSMNLQSVIPLTFQGLTRKPVILTCAPVPQLDTKVEKLCVCCMSGHLLADCKALKSKVQAAVGLFIMVSP